ncbi:TPA: sulfatase [Vibrio parahaemolyticus]
MSFKKTLVACTVGVACATAPMYTIAADKEQPNVLVIVLDDLGKAQLDFAMEDIDKEVMKKRPQSTRFEVDFDKGYEAAKQAMPNIVKLASEGVSMTNAYVSTPVCGPSRAGILTGRYPHSFGTYSNVDAKSGIPLDVTMLPELLQESGYATANIGKFHNAKVKRTKVAEDKRTHDYHDNVIFKPEKGFFPNDRGFDYSYSFFASGTALYDSPSIFRNYENADASGFITHNLTNETLGFIDKAEKEDKPFFINLAYSVPHIPLEANAPAKYMDKFNTGNPEVDRYYAHVNASDEGIGKIIQKLKDTGEYENTLIFFLSDNGAVGDSPMPLNGDNKAFKGQRYRGGINVPFIAHWKGVLPEGVKNDTMISGMDILPTALKAAGVAIPSELKVNGVDILPTLKGEKTQPHDYLYWAGPRAFHFDIEKNDDFWQQYWKWVTYEGPKFERSKFVEKKSRGEWAIYDQEWSLHFYDNFGKPEYELYHYASDASESKNVIEQNPKKFKEMKAEFYQWIKDKPKPLRWGDERYDTMTSSAK